MTEVNWYSWELNSGIPTPNLECVSPVLANPGPCNIYNRALHHAIYIIELCNKIISSASKKANYLMVR